jgi:Domain of unknown function (DUF2760)
MGFGKRVSYAFRAFFALLGSGQLPDDIAQEAAPAAAPEAAEPAAKAAAPSTERPDAGAVLMLGVLQREGRLVDFLMEDLSGYPDAQIGAAVRDVHANCRRALVDAFELEPVLDAAEEQPVTVPQGFDPATIKLVGRVTGTGPFNGVLRHRGWRSSKVQLPALPPAEARHIVAPAEVELS